MSVIAMPHVLTNLVIMTVNVMKDTLVMALSAQMSMNVFIRMSVTEMLSVPTMMVHLPVHVIMDILVMVLTHVTNWIIWRFIMKPLKNGRVPLVITDRHSHVMMIMNVI